MSDNDDVPDGIRRFRPEEFDQLPPNVRDLAISRNEVIDTIRATKGNGPADAVNIITKTLDIASISTILWVKGGVPKKLIVGMTEMQGAVYSDLFAVIFSQFVPIPKGSGIEDRLKIYALRNELLSIATKLAEKRSAVDLKLFGLGEDE